MPCYHIYFHNRQIGSNFAAEKTNKIMDIIMKIVALGDSIIKGVLFNQEENGRGHYSLSDHNIVDNIANQLHSETVNLGKMGCTIEVGERILDRHIDALDGAKYVLMCYGGNDSDYNWKAIADNPKEQHYPKTPLTLFEKTYTRIIHHVREMGCIPLIMSLPPMDAQKYFNFFTSTFNDMQKSNVLNWLKGNIDTIWAGHELYNDAVKRVAEATDSIFVDVTTSLGNGKGILCDDGIHPNTLGQRKIANIILKNIV